MERKHATPERTSPSQESATFDLGEYGSLLASRRIFDDLGAKVHVGTHAAVAATRRSVCRLAALSDEGRLRNWRHDAAV